MTTDMWTERLSEYIDDELPAAERAELEAHLLDCRNCSVLLGELRAVVLRAGQVIDRPPQEDLWAGIAAQIARPEVRSETTTTTRRRFSFSIPQLAAASIALMLLSSGTMYMMMNGDDAVAPVAGLEQPAGGVAQPAAAGPAGPAQTTDALVRSPQPVKSLAADDYSVAIDELEVALEAGRARLDTATVRVLEQNLRTIDVAISEARQALSRDPANPYLNRYLDETMQRKIQLLRRATRIMRAQT